MLFEQFPYTNFHEINLDWLLNRVKEMEREFVDYKASVTTIIKENLSEIAFSAIYDAGKRTIYLNVDEPSTLDLRNQVQVLSSTTFDNSRHIDAIEKDAMKLSYERDNVIKAQTLAEVMRDE